MTKNKKKHALNECLKILELWNMNRRALEEEPLEDCCCGHGKMHIQLAQGSSSSCIHVPLFPRSQLHSSRPPEVFFQWTHWMTTTAPRLRFSVQGYIVSTLGWSCSYNNLLKDVMKR